MFGIRAFATAFSYKIGDKVNEVAIVGQTIKNVVMDGSSLASLVLASAHSPVDFRHGWYESTKPRNPRRTTMPWFQPARTLRADMLAVGALAPFIQCSDHVKSSMPIRLAGSSPKFKPMPKILAWLHRRLRRRSWYLTGFGPTRTELLRSKISLRSSPRATRGIPLDHL